MSGDSSSQETGASLSDVFNELVKNAIEKSRKVPVVVVTEPETRVLIQEWLSKPESKSFLDVVRKGKRQSLGIVFNTKKKEGKTEVNYFDQSGMKMSFDFYPGEDYFENAQDGFKEGDIILNKLMGLKTESVKRLDLDDVIRGKVLDKFSRLVEKSNET